MRIFLTYVLSFLIPFALFAQDDKRDHIWVLGDPLPNVGWGGSIIDFNVSPPDTSFFDITYPLQALTEISNTNGELACYSNGCRIINGNHETVVDGDQIGPGEVYNLYCDVTGYPLAQPIILLPNPGHTDQYILFHHTVKWVNGLLVRTDFLYTVVDMTAEGGQGKVLLKNQPLIEGGDLAGHVTATRHGNGRDWWVVVPTWDGYDYFTFLLTPYGIEGPFLHHPYPVGLELWNAGQIGFSPDGSWYVESLGKSQLRLMRFDRCSGEFYDAQQFDFQGDTVEASGVAFSPNSKVLYVSQPLKIYQYDLTASNIQASRQVVAEYDGFTYFNLPITFFQAMLGPDDRIYLTATNGTWHLHVIEHPDSLGLACEVKQHGFRIPTQQSFSVPNFPYFRLYDLEGSVCDSLGINGSVSTTAPPPGGYQPTKVYPNPVSDLLNVELPAAARWSVLNLQGQVVTNGQSAGGGLLPVSVGSLRNGVYALVLTYDSGRTETVRFVVLR